MHPVSVAELRTADSHSSLSVILEKWINSTRDQFGAKEGMALYWVPGLPELKVESLHAVMQKTIESLNIAGVAVRATSHSLRYGGATMMAAAGFPQYLIAHYGGWTTDSKCFRLYARPTAETISLVSKHMVSMAMKGCSSVFVMDAVIRSHTAE